MFGSVERKLALLNVSVVVAIVAMIGIGTWILLRQALDQEADTSLEDRIESARLSLVALPSEATATVTPRTSANDDDEDNHDDELEEESREILVSGDTLVFVFDDAGNLITNRRNVVLNRIPDQESVSAALDGETDTRIVTVEGDRVRIRTEPVRAEGEIAGAIQAVRSEAEHDEELALVRTMTLVGTGIGVLIAVPAGMYLTRRAMTPINDVLHRQRAFVSDASHELRTPLTILRANAEVLTRTPDISRAELESELHAMIGDIDAMSYLVDQLLQLSRVDSPDYAITLEAMPLQASIERAVKMLAPMAETSQIRLDYGRTALRIRSNREIVEQILRILLDNAIRYTAEGGTVSVTASHSGDHAVIDVRDTGIGIQPEDLPYVFDRFYRGDKARTRSTGTGLGLSIARGLVTLLGGTISIESTPGQGTTVRVSLPTASTSPDREGSTL
jgi:two-component system, OmpR family, sensor histidine kinase CiaH